MSITRKITIILSSLLLISIFIRSSYLYQFEGSLNWGLTEWLVNYEGGFIRRGLLGELLLYIHNNYYLPVNKIIILTSMFLYIYLLYFFIKKTKEELPIELILSPLLMGMPLLTEFFVRKDILGIILLIFIIKICKFKIDFKLSFLLVNFFFIIALLINETFLFYSFLVIFILKIKNYNTNENTLKIFFKNIFFFSPVLICFFYLVIVNTNFSGHVDIHNSWQKLWIFIDPINCCNYKIGGEILALHDEKINFAIVNFLKNYPLKFFIWILFISICPIILINVLTNQSYENRKFFLKIILIQFVSVFPLFVFAGDWGRWIFLWLASSIIFYVSKIKIDYVFLKIIDKISDKLLKFKIFNININSLIFLMIGFPMVHYQWSIYNYFMKTVLGKISAIIYKIITKGISVYF